MSNSHTFQRISAYFIDVFLITLISVILTIGIPNSKKYDNALKENDSLISDYVDNKITESEYIDRIYKTKYTMEKESITTSLISVVVTFAYFAGFAYYSKGQTLGKKLLRIKVVSKDGNEASYLKMMFRALIHNGCLTSILSIILILFIKSNQYMYTIGVLEMLQSVIMISSIIMIICRKDKKGLHDLVCGTTVVEC